MKALLDTHVWLWYVSGSSRLSGIHRRLIEKAGTELWLSPISIWEAYMLIEKKKLGAIGSRDEWLEDAFRLLDLREAPITFKIAARSRDITLPHSDPADRFIAATAAEMKIPLLTADENLIGCPDITCR